MSDRTFGEALYQQFVSKGERRRFLYADAKILKSIRSLEELQKLCGDVSGEMIADDTPPDQMLEACTVREMDESDAGAVGSVFASDIGGCLIGIVMVPILISGVVLGRLVSLLGLRLEPLAQHHALKLAVMSGGLLVTGLGLAALTRSEWPLWLASMSGVFAGLARSRGAFGETSFTLLLAVITPIAILLVPMFFLGHIGLAPAVVSTFTMGTGYGMCRSFEQLFEKRRGMRVEKGAIVLLKPQLPACHRL